MYASLLLLAAATAQQPLPAPVTVHPGGCDSCHVAIRLETTIGRVDDAFGIGPATTLGRTAGGEYLVASLATPGEVAVYGADGRYRRSFGRPGGGPGEYRAISRIRDLGSASSTSCRTA